MFFIYFFFFSNLRSATGKDTSNGKRSRSCVPYGRYRIGIKYSATIQSSIGHGESGTWPVRRRRHGKLEKLSHATLHFSHASSKKCYIMHVYAYIVIVAFSNLQIRIAISSHRMALSGMASYCGNAIWTRSSPVSRSVTYASVFSTSTLIKYQSYHVALAARSFILHVW